MSSTENNHRTGTTYQIEKSDFAGRSPWILIATHSDGRIETSWHKTKREAIIENQRLAGWSK